VLGSARDSRAVCGDSPQTEGNVGMGEKFVMARRHQQHASRVRSPEIPRPLQRFSLWSRGSHGLITSKL
jgi:hypothetical protein